MVTLFTFEYSFVSISASWNACFLRAKATKKLRMPPLFSAPHRPTLRYPCAEKLTVQKTSLWIKYKLANYFLGVSLRVGLSRSIFQGAGKHSISKQSAPRAQKGYLRISLTRFASCIVPTSPAITTAPLVCCARAPERCAKIRSNSQIT